MKLLVTGGAGFIGSAVVRAAVGRGLSVVNVDRLAYSANLENLASVAGSPLHVFVKADIRDGLALADLAATQCSEPILGANIDCPSTANQLICQIR